MSLGAASHSAYSRFEPPVYKTDYTSDTIFFLEQTCVLNETSFFFPLYKQLLKLEIDGDRPDPPEDGWTSPGSISQVPGRQLTP